MTDPDPAAWSATAVAKAIAARQLSAREYLSALLARIGKYNDELRLVVTIDERAEQQAFAADEAAVRGRLAGPLHGVALTVKDSFATAGLRTTAGSPRLAGHIPRRDADAVEALRGAGAIVFGKTNLAENCADVQSANPLFGASANPWQPKHTTGGSSGGSAGAVAARFTAAELGSDIAGSIRIPAAACGVPGHRPSFGIVPIRGHHPPYQPVVPDLAVAGPLARTVEDLGLLLDVLIAPNHHDRVAWQLRLPPARRVQRVAVWFDDPHCPVDAEVKSALEHAAQVLRDRGIAVEQAAPPGVSLAAADEAGRRLLASIAQISYTPQDIDAIAAGVRAPGAELGAEFVAQTYHAWLTADARRERMRARWHDFFTHYDALLLPVVPQLVAEHDLRPFAERRITVNGRSRPYWDQTAWISLTGIARLPTTVVPVRLDSRGLPIGVAITGPYLADRTSLALAATLTAGLPPLGVPAFVDDSAAVRPGQPDGRAIPGRDSQVDDPPAGGAAPDHP